MKNKFSNDIKSHFLKTLDSDPTFSQAHYQLGLVYQKCREDIKAEYHFLEAIQLDTKMINDFEKKGNILIEKSQFQNAKSLFMKSQEKKINCSLFHYKLALLYLHQKKRYKANKYLINSITLNPFFAEAHRDLGILVLAKGNYDDAQFHIEKAINIKYSDCLSHLKLSMILKQKKQYNDAEQHLLSALDINPNDIDLLIEMIYLQLIMKNKKEAKKYFLLAEKISPAIKNNKFEEEFN